jgi:hypothetical protein
LPSVIQWRKTIFDINCWLYFFIIKPTRYTNLTNLFWHEILHISEGSSVHHQVFIHCTLKMVYVIQVWRQPSSGTILVLLESCVYSACMTYTIAECTVNKLLMMDRGTLRNM